MKFSRIALVAFGLATIVGSGSALAQSRAIAIEPVTAAPAAPAVEAPKAPVAEGGVKVETPKVEIAKEVETPKVEPRRLRPRRS